MNESNESKKKEKKIGFWAYLSSLFRGGSSGAGGAAGFGSAGARLGSSGSGFGSWFASLFGSTSGLAGLFSTKAGIMGIILSVATIAAGIGVLYNFLGPSSKSVYTPNMFQDTYYDEQAQNAARERAKQLADASASGFDMFRDQAKKDGLGLGEDGENAEKKDASAEDAAAEDKAAIEGASADSSANIPTGGGPKLQTVQGFGSSKGGGSTLAGGSGMFGGVNSKFAPIYKAPAGQGNSSGIKSAKASPIKSASKRASSFKKRGAFGQAKYAKAQGVRAAGSSTAATSKTGATEAFSGETGGAGDVGTAGGGAGLNGSGVTDGNKLKNSDPNLSSNDSTPPAATPAAEDVSPWEKYTDLALYGMIASALFIFIANSCAKKAKALLAKAKAAAAVPGGAAAAAPIFAAAIQMYNYAIYAAYAAMAAAAVVVYAGLKLMQDYEQKWTGIMYMAAGGMLIYKAYEAVSGAQEGIADAQKIVSETTTGALATGASTAPVGASGGVGTVGAKTP
ncbi:MAG: hypothetical protein WCK75_06280 [Elusimicrobiota bacterium]